ncbi:alginate export family protein [Arhodomonas aquaeolei]|uniref:alginate export family protein n=1 Tax=Arhodomonas aquaeolei TaxID=2369 RepID=UPI000687FB91|nr:alginate export family protein [Arhodomonas aquaeolei]
MPRRIIPLGPLAPCTAAVLALASANAAAYEVYSGEDGSSLSLDTELGVGYFSSQQDYTGQGRDEVNWTEGYFKAGVSGERVLGNGASVYGALNGLASATDGDGDAGGFSTGDESEFDVEDAYVGWRSGSLIGGVDDAVDLSIGSQSFTVGDGWLINGDALNFGEGFGDSLSRGGAYWLAPRHAFRRTAIARFETGTPWRGDAFYLGSDNDAQGDTELAGLNVEYNDEGWGTLGATYLHVLDVDEDDLGGAYASRDGLNTVSLRGNSSLGIDNADFRFEATVQRGSPDNAADVDAHAWYVEGSYQFADVWLAPRLAYRFSSFSGDDPDTTDNEAFDPLFYGFSRGYGTWFQGEVAGNYTGPFNSNTDVQHVGLYLHPHERVRLGALYFDFNTRETAPGTSDDYARELDVFMEYAVTERLFISPVYSRFNPGDGFSGPDETNNYFQVIAIWNF